MSSKWDVKSRNNTNNSNGGNALDMLDGPGGITSVDDRRIGDVKGGATASIGGAIPASSSN